MRSYGPAQKAPPLNPDQARAECQDAAIVATTSLSVAATSLSRKSWPFVKWSGCFPG